MRTAWKIAELIMIECCPWTTSDSRTMLIALRRKENRIQR